ncbi:MAG: biotin--[Eubacterium sp.]|nr:biotin--[acetyl-CoA-carboxylase] ligase [Eubacterium sp.]
MNRNITDTLISDGYLSKLNIFDEVGSTNALAKELVQSSETIPVLPQLFVADMQTAGRGRLGRSWTSPAGTGIWMSYLSKPDISPDLISGITILAALAVTKALTEYGSRHDLSISPMIKWPNDIVVNGKKICGILTELVSIPNPGSYDNYVICGIGINVNTESFPEDIADKATSLYLETGKMWIREEIIRDTIVFLSEYISEYEKQNSLEFIREEYNSYLISLNQEVRLIDNSSDFSDKIYTSKGIDATGALLVTDPDGNTSAVRSGEVSVRGLYGYT